MERASLSWKIRAWYRFARRGTRELRRVCITLFSVVMAVHRVLEWAASLFNNCLSKRTSSLPRMNAPKAPVSPSS